MARTATDPLAPLTELPGVTDAVARARDALVRVHNHPVNRRGWPATAAEAGLRAARASAVLDGARPDPAPGDIATDPVLAGAVRAAEELGRLLGVWRTAPLQALARLHVVAAADLVPGRSEIPGPGMTPDPDGAAGAPVAAGGAAVSPLGRPSGSPATSAAISARLSLLADLVTGGTSVPAPIVVAVVHGELLALAPFPNANGVVARAAARLAAVATGLDPKGLAVPEVGHLRRAVDYHRAAQGFATGTREGLTDWLLHCCAQWEAGAREGTSIADARS